MTMISTQINASETFNLNPIEMSSQNFYATQNINGKSKMNSEKILS